MKAPRAALPPEALWEVLQELPLRVLRAVQKSVDGTRLSWLLKVLLEMETYSEAELHKRFRTAFPGAKTELLRAYKRLLWNVLERILLEQYADELNEEIQVWRRLWLSILLWHRGRAPSARILWSQSMEKAAQMGWYEVLLWGFSTIDLYESDFHFLVPQQSPSAWLEHLLKLINQRYAALIQKVYQKEVFILTRDPRGVSLPALPSFDGWAKQLELHTQFIQVVDKEPFDYIRLFEISLHQLNALIESPSTFPTRSTQIQLALTGRTIAVLLFYSRAWRYYEDWISIYKYFHSISPNKNSILFEETYMLETALKLIYFFHSARWAEAASLADACHSKLEKRLMKISGDLTIGSTLACMIYAAFLLSPAHERSAISWRLRLETWIQRVSAEDVPYLWWTFLRWYEAYRYGDIRYRRHWYRRLRRLWQERFSDLQHWRPILRLLWGLTEMPHIPQRIRLEKLWRHWKRYPSEQRFWERGMFIFPMRLFIESIQRRVPLESLPPRPLPEEPLPPELAAQVEAIFHAFRERISSEKRRKRN